ncbi:MAG: LPS assembly protein LptD [Woeseia sp.]
MPRYLTSICSATLLLIATTVVAADERMACASGTVDDGFPDWQLPANNDNTIVFEAGKVEASVGPAPTAKLSEGVRLTSGDRMAGADSAVYDPDDLAVLLTGNVQYRDPNTRIQSDSAVFSYASGRITFEGAEFRLGENGARGAAEVLEISRAGTLSLADVSYTTCPPGSNDWLLEAGNIDIDTDSGNGTARNVKLRFQGVPILYAPFLSFPLGDARKTGMLTPEIGSAGRSGNELSVPWYWNIAPNYDATFTPRLLTDRGLQLGNEFRYLFGDNEGTAQVEYLANDDLYGDSRLLVAFDHRSYFGNSWRQRINFRQTSDGQYFEDLGGSLSASSTTHLNRAMAFDYLSENWSLLARVQDYQTIDDAIIATDRPYRRLPQLRVRGTWPEQRLGLRYLFDGELTYFDRDIGTTGWRFDASPQVEWPLERPGWYVSPSVTLRHTQYGLSNTAGSVATSPSRTLPIGSVDAGMVLERQVSGAGLLQTIEPRIRYVHIPYREQSDLPVFDTIIPDLNLVQLFRPNRFLGADRITDTDQLSIGVTSRILNASSGKELVTATIGQALYLSQQGVRLPDQTSDVGESSDYIAEMRCLLYEHVNFDFGHQWGTGENGTTQSEARLQYRPAQDRVLNLAYRYRRGALEQGDLSWSWPLAQRWRFVGRYNYSMRDRKALEQFYGLEYESCCWGLRLVSRRHISTRDGTRDSSIGLQLVLKGMTSVGTAADKLLERGILGYSPDL